MIEPIDPYKQLSQVWYTYTCMYIHYNVLSKELVCLLA